MIDCFDYKCEEIREVSPLIRITNTWPSLPPEEVNYAGLATRYNWEELFDDIKELYEDGVTIAEIGDILGFVGTDVLKRRIREWVRRGKIETRPRHRAPNKWTDHFTTLLIERLANGGNCTDVAAEIGLNKESVLYHARRLNYAYDKNKASWVKENTQNE